MSSNYMSVSERDGRKGSWRWCRGGSLAPSESSELDQSPASLGSSMLRSLRSACSAVQCSE